MTTRGDVSLNPQHNQINRCVFVMGSEHKDHSLLVNRYPNSWVKKKKIIFLGEQRSQPAG